MHETSGNRQSRRGRNDAMSRLQNVSSVSYGSGDQPEAPNMDSTTDTYSTLNEAFQFFNERLFNGALPTCLITLQRKGRANGFFARAVRLERGIRRVRRDRSQPAAISRTRHKARVVHAGARDGPSLAAPLWPSGSQRLSQPGMGGPNAPARAGATRHGQGQRPTDRSARDPRSCDWRCVRPRLR